MDVPTQDSPTRSNADEERIADEQATHDPLPEVTVYTDGGCRPNPGPGGWGAVILTSGATSGGSAPVRLKGGEPDATNNRMELRAAIEALRHLDRPHRVDLYTDSTYLRKGVTEWLEGWRQRGWSTSQRTAVKNQDLWQELSSQTERHQVRWHWTKGHAGNRWNEEADRLAGSAIERPSLPVDDQDAVHLYTAAAYSGKTRTGGWAVVLGYRDSERVLEGHEPATSPNRMHLVAAVRGLESLKRPVRLHLYTASDYLKDGATAWVRGWKARQWRTKEGKPVSHRDLWETLDRLSGDHRVEWHVVASEDMPPLMEKAKEHATYQARGDRTKK